MRDSGPGELSADSLGWLTLVALWEGPPGAPLRSSPDQGNASLVQEGALPPSRPGSRCPPSALLVLVPLSFVAALVIGRRTTTLE